MKISNLKSKFITPESGQILLITIMLVATILTVVLAVTFKSSTETQLTKLEEESQKALSAAEAGVEAALQQDIGDDPVLIKNLPNISGTGFTGEATVGSISGPTFVAPLLQKDQEYTFYLSDYPGFGNPFDGNLALYFMSEGSCPSLELTFITTNNSVSRRLVDPCNNVNKPDEDLGATNGNYPLEGYSFSYLSDSFNVDASDNNAVMIVRTLFAPTRIGFERLGGGNLPVQGKYVISEAKAASGVTKKVQLFQSFPQIPAEFFVTSF